MKRKLEISELIFKIISYTLLTVFALCCLYPFVYAVFASISGRAAVDYGEVVLFPKDIQFDAFKRMFNDNIFWNSYSNTLFLTLYGTIWAMGVAILGAYALSKRGFVPEDLQLFPGLHHVVLGRYRSPVPELPGDQGRV